MDTNQPVEQPTPEPVQPVAPVAAPVANTSNSNPGMGLGIASIIVGFFGAFFLWVIGLPLGIASIVKSNKAKASPLLGIIGTVLNVLAIGFSILVLLWVIGAASSLQKKADTQAQQTTSTTSSSAADIPLNKTYAMSDGGNALWVFPSSHSGWTMKTIDEKGYNVMQADDGHAQFMSYQGNESMTAASDAAMTNEGLTTFIEATKGTKTGSQGAIDFEQLSDAKTIEFATQQYTYTNTSGKAMKAIIALRIYDGGHSLFVTYAATADTFSLSEWQELAGKMQINDGVL